MSYQALYRVWRPQQFKDVIGQEAITKTLKNALITGQTSHAYLFTGPRGTGKTSVAKILAKALNCLHLEISVLAFCLLKHGCCGVRESKRLSLCKPLYFAAGLS